MKKVLYVAALIYLALLFVFVNVIFFFGLPDYLYSIAEILLLFMLLCNTIAFAISILGKK